MTAVGVHVVLLLTVTTDPSSAIVSRAAVESLAAPFTEPPRVVLRELPRSPDPEQVGALALETKADSTVVLTCAGPGCARAELRVVGDEGRGPARRLQFSARDELGERGRAIGLLASTLLPERWSRIDQAAPPATNVAPAGPAVTAVTAVTAAGAVPLAPRLRWGAETLASMFAGTSGGVSDFGLTLGLRRGIADGWAARAAIKLELGDLPSGAGTIRGGGAALGIAWTSSGLERPGHLGVGARADVVALYRQAHVIEPTEVEDSRSVAFGGDAVALVGYALSAGAAVIGGVGAEMLTAPAATTDDDLTGMRVSPRWLRLVVELGILARF